MINIKKKGFTLIELLAVIVVLGIILVIAIPNVIDLINKAKQDAYERQKELIVEVAQKYILQNVSSLTWTDNKTTVYLKDLQDAKLIDNPLKDPRGGTFNNTLTGTRVIVTKNNDQYSYDLIAVSGIDKTPPVLALVGLDTIDIIEGSTYTDQGATATDDVDGDITSKITVTNSVNTSIPGSYTITYKVIDNSGNMGEITRTVNVLANQKPVITLSGLNNVYISKGDTYIDAGATATDDVDGNITSNIVAVNNVNSGVVGTYTVTYNVTDSSGKAATGVTRTVYVAPVGYIASEGVNQPRLIAGMIPIKWNGTAWIETTPTDPDWYSYTTADKKWANAKTADGSMWVWLPRYGYQITGSYHYYTTGTINVKFLKDNTNVAADGSTVSTTATYSGSNQTNYIVHPSFNFGGTEVTGIWVAKFEASVADTSNSCYTTANATNCNKNTLLPKIVPNVSSWRYINVGNMFTVSRNMETNNIYGWGTTGTGLDTHLMKNIEWGAVAYLSQSTYGKNSEVWVNNSSTYITGCAGDSVSTTTTYAGCQFAYGTANGVNASTTGNIYGIYDMVGGAWEIVSAYVSNGNGNLTNYGGSIISADIKYRDVYTVTTDDQTTNYNNAASKKGDAVYETSYSGSGSDAWNGDASWMPYANYPWFMRGGWNSYGTAAGLFNFNTKDGTYTNNSSFRIVLTLEV